MNRSTRRYAEPSTSQSDRDRILYNPEFRRLASVTQVAVAEGCLLFHNRLTHSLKVAQIARRLASRLNSQYRELADALGGIDEEVCESAALAHDLGHPPFGHVAERRLDKLMVKGDVADGFEGNPQSFRIVTKLAVHRKEYEGLNLSRATLAAILKYPWHRQTTGKAAKKWGAFHSEKDDFTFARNNRSDTAPSLEAQIMTWADDITYSVHDIEDFYQAGLIPLDRFGGPGRSGEADRFLTGVAERRQREGLQPKYNWKEQQGVFLRLFQNFPIPSGPYTGGRRQQAALKSFSQAIIDNYVERTGLEDNSSLDDLLKRDDDVLMEVDILKELLWFYVIKNPALASQEYGQGQVIEGLFTILADATSANDPDRWHILPGRAREMMGDLRNKFGPSSIRTEDRLRVAADTVAGMTEQQAMMMFHRLTAVSPGSLFQPIVV